MLAYAHGLTTALNMQRVVVALALAASVQAFAPPRVVATTPAAKSVLPLKSAVAEESFEFTAETDRVMEIIINSLYSDKDVFL